MKSVAEPQRPYDTAPAADSDHRERIVERRCRLPGVWRSPKRDAAVRGRTRTIRP